MTPERIEAQKRRLQWMMSGESVPPPSNSKLTLVEEIALCDLALKGLQAEEMREAIRRIADQTPDEQTRRYALETLADLEQALNERKET